MKKISVISLFILSLFVACNKIEDDKTVDTRFFPANSIRCLNALIFNYVQDEEGNHIKIAPDTVYFESWTGNDTIIDGRECVILWEKYERDMSEFRNIEPVTPNVPLCVGAIHEAGNGYVYLYRYGGWTILYDFSDSSWELGDELYVMDGDGPFYEPILEEITDLSSYTLCNGEEVAVANGLMYGIGYNDRAFFTPQTYTNPYVPVDIPVEFYRDGVLLYQRWPQSCN